MPNRTKCTPKKRADFLEALRAEAGNVTKACTHVGIARRTMYGHRDDNPDFAAAWQEVEDAIADTMERELYRRAVEGVEKPVYYQGDEVGVIREYSDTLLIFGLKGARPEKYRERTETRHTFEPIDWELVPDELRDAFIDGKVTLEHVRSIVKH